jgi:hypothetical protein
MMNCRGMGAVTKKGNKPKVMAKGKKVPGKLKGYAEGMTVPLPPRVEARIAAMENARSKGGSRMMAKGKTVKRKMKGKKVY